MTSFGNDWWPAGVARPRLRLLAGLAAAPAILAAIATALGYAVGGMTLPAGEQVAAQAMTVGLTALGALLAFSGSFGLIAVLALWIARLRSALAFALAGAAAGALFAVFTILVMTSMDLKPHLVAIMAVTGALALLIVRWIAGVRARAPQ